MSLPKILKHIRTFNKLTQLELSNKLGICRSYISQIEKGVKKPTNETLNKAKKLLTKSSLGLLDWISK
jgi:transcriptional regulator with XRE-family HTH domain